MNFIYFTTTSPSMEEKVVKMENGLSIIKNQMQTLLVYIVSRQDVL